MKKLSIAMLSIFCCTQQINSMKQHTPPSNNEGYPIVIKDPNDLPKPTPISKEFNKLSEQLYKENITDAEIRELVRKGAVLNYQRRGSDWPLVFEYAYDNRVDNMRTVIELGAAIHNIQYQTKTPLVIALKNDHPSLEEDKDCSAMIQFLIPYENPTVTIYKRKEHDKDGCRPGDITTEQNIRNHLISHSIYHPNITTIKLLIKHKLMTANCGLSTFAYYQTPNQEVLDLLLAYGADNGGDLLVQLVQTAFTSEQYTKFFRQMCDSKAFNKDVLQKMLTIQENVDAIVSTLQANQPK